MAIAVDERGTMKLISPFKVANNLKQHIAWVRIAYICYFFDEMTFHVKHEIQEVELNVLNIDFAEIRETI